MPIDVININTSTAVTKYIFNTVDIFGQYLYRNEAVTNLPASSDVPISTTAQNVPLNIWARPYILKKAAAPAIEEVITPNNIINAIYHSNDDLIKII
jgi:hypothetical protein